MATAVKRCTCQHEWQDKRYGKGYRLMNLKAPVTGRPQEYTCTVCRKERQ